jgi:hypothetical protein
MKEMLQYEVCLAVPARMTDCMLWAEVEGEHNLKTRKLVDPAPGGLPGRGEI